MSNKELIDGFVGMVREVFSTNEFVPLHAPYFGDLEKELVLETLSSTFVSSVGKFVDLFDQTSIQTLNKRRKILKVKKNIKVENNDSSVELKPNNQFSIDFEIDFPSKLVSKQSCQLQLVNGNYKTDIASARTFGFERDVDMLRSNGLALGGSLDNAVVVGESKILNSDGLRFKDEFVRHKILDSIGDLYLAGTPIHGYFLGNKSGHHLNNLLLRSLFADKDNYEYI